MNDSTSLVKLFNFESNQLTVITIDGEPWFIAREVGRILEYADNGRALINNISGRWSNEFDEDMLYKMEGEKLKQLKRYLSGNFTRVSSLMLLSEQGVYKGIALSRKLVGKRLRDLLISEFSVSGMLSGSNGNKEGDKDMNAGNSNDLVKLFNFENSQLTVITMDGEPWFIAREIGRILEYHDDGKGFIELVSGKWKDEFDDEMLCKLEGEKLKWFKDVRQVDYQTTSPSNDFYRVPSLLLLSEQGVYQAVMLSKKPVGKKLRKWLSKEVLPSIRKTGQYVDPVKDADDEIMSEIDIVVQQSEVINRQAILLKRVRDEQRRQAAEIERQAKVQNDHDERLEKIEVEKEKVRDAIEKILEPGGEATPKTIRTQVNQLIKTYAFIFAVDYKFVYDRMYREYNRRERTNIHVRCKKHKEKREKNPELKLKKKSKMDFIDEDGKMSNFYNICYEILMPEIKRKNDDFKNHDYEQDCDQEVVYDYFYEWN